MKILVVGSGGREHALAWKLRGGHAPHGDREIVVAPGNAGIAREFRCESVAPGPEGVVALARREAPDLVVIGPESALVDGTADALAAAGVRVFGPNAAAARLEGSKAFMKDVCARAGVASAEFVATSSLEEARAFIATRAEKGAGVVVKADGLCAGKGVVVHAEAHDAEATVRAFLGTDGPPRFGEASRTVVLEDLLPGDELSVFGICDGHDALLFGAARDHKRLLDGDRGPNTGGMGAVAPLDAQAGVSDEMLARVRNEIFLPVLAEMRARDAPFHGLLFAGLMVHEGAVRVLEFNVRFGDPETQALLVASSVDVLPLLHASASGARFTADMRARAAADQKACVVVVAAEGYPEAPVRGAVLQGLEAAAALPGVKIFSAGLGEENGALVAAGGRVLSVTGAGTSFDEALARAYAAVARIHLPGAQHRRDIGASVRAR